MPNARGGGKSLLHYNRQENSGKKKWFSRRMSIEGRSSVFGTGKLWGERNWIHISRGLNISEKLKKKKRGRIKRDEPRERRENMPGVSRLLPKEKIENHIFFQKGGKRAIRAVRTWKKKKREKRRLHLPLRGRKKGEWFKDENKRGGKRK